MNNQIPYALSPHPQYALRTAETATQKSAAGPTTVGVTHHSSHVHEAHDAFEGDVKTFDSGIERGDFAAPQTAAALASREPAAHPERPPLPRLSEAFLTAQTVHPIYPSEAFPTAQTMHPIYGPSYFATPRVSRSYQDSHVWQYATGETFSYQAPQARDVSLEFRQQALTACAMRAGAPKSGKPASPAPIIELKVSAAADSTEIFRCNPHFFMHATLCDPDGNPVTQKTAANEPLLGGSLVSSSHSLLDEQNKKGTFFLFGDLILRGTGTFRLKFSLFDLRRDGAALLATQLSEPFETRSQKEFRGLHDSALSRAFLAQGAKHLPLPQTSGKKRYAATFVSEEPASKRTQTANPDEGAYHALTYHPAAFPAMPQGGYAQHVFYGTEQPQQFQYGYAPNDRH